MEMIGFGKRLLVMGLITGVYIGGSVTDLLALDRCCYQVRKDVFPVVSPNTSSECSFISSTATQQIAFDTTYAAAAQGSLFKFFIHLPTGQSELVSGMCEGGTSSSGGKPKQRDAVAAESLLSSVSARKVEAGATVAPSTGVDSQVTR